METAEDEIFRIVWLCVTTALATWCIFLCINSYIQWYENPIITSVSTTGYDIKHLDFPAITIWEELHLQQNLLLIETPLIEYIL